mgnify:CR=1 FL=1
MPATVVIDSGPLVALFDRDDRFHADALKFIQRLTSRAVSNLAVVTEVSCLLDFSRKAQRDFWQWVRSGAVVLIEPTAADWDRMLELLQKYSDRPMDFTDATLVALCERLETRDIASVDSDFTVYRYRNRQPFKNRFFDDQ